jgi:maltose-binding protein MalE
MWNEFYKHDPAAKGRKGGWHWGEPTANAPEVVEALQFMVDLKKEGYSSYPDIGGGTTLQGLFASNHIGMTPGGGFWAGGLHNAGMKTNQFDVQYFPAWATQKHLLGTGGYALLKQSKNKQLAFEFLLTLTSPGAIEAVVNGNVTTPARRSLMKASSYGPTGPKHWSVFYDTLDKFPNTTPIPAPPFYQGLANSLNVRTTQAMSSGKVQVALNAMQKDLEKLHKSSKHG